MRHKFSQLLPEQLSFWRGALTLLEEHDVLASSSCVHDVGKETFSCSLQWQCATISHYDTADVSAGGDFDKVESLARSVVKVAAAVVVYCVHKGWRERQVMRQVGIVS